MRRVVITGLGALTPIGNNVDTFWQNLVAGTSGAGPITRFDASKFKTQFACELKDFNAEDHLDKKEARKMDIYCQYALVAAGEAIKQAGLDSENIDKDRVGVIWGSGNGGIRTFQEEMMNYAAGDGTPRFNPFFVPKMIVDMGAGLISIHYGFRGPNYTTVSACATGSTAIINAFHYIKWGYADAMVTGGSEAAITEAGIGGFNACRALSTRNEDAAGASRPFDKERDGFVMGEGAGALVLEEYEHAIARGATILGEVLGGGMSGDAYHMTGTHPEGAGAALAMNMALRDANLKPSEIDYVNMHATSTPLGDMSEIKGLQTVFGDHCFNGLSISATKSQTGHLLGAAGAIEAIACILAVRDGIVPPTINTEHLDDAIPAGLDLTLGKANRKPIRYAMSNTFGFGGHNAIAIFGKAE